MSHNWEVTLPGATDKYVMKIPANIAQAQHGALYFYRQQAGQHATLLYVFSPIGYSAAHRASNGQWEVIPAFSPGETISVTADGFHTTDDGTVVFTNMVPNPAHTVAIFAPHTYAWIRYEGPRTRPGKRRRPSKTARPKATRRSGAPSKLTRRRAQAQ